MTPVEFYAARLDELEALAVTGDCRCRWRELRADCPDFIVADIAAKRAVIAELGPPHYITGGSSAAFRAVVAQFIQPFSAHPDFEESWKL